jgi:hypothetical protein
MPHLPADSPAQPGLVELAQLPPKVRRELLGRELLDRELLDRGSSPTDPLAAITHLRRDRPDLSPELASAVIAQRGYQQRARDKELLPAGGPWLTTAVGLEQATRAAVAAHRAQRLANAGIASVVDIGAGIGMDACAFLAAGLDVAAIEKDPTTAHVCRANTQLAAEIHTRHATVECADATRPGVIAKLMAQLPHPVALFVDPARRSDVRPIDGSRAPTERDPERWSPPWSFIENLRSDYEHVAVKAPPSFDPYAQASRHHASQELNTIDWTTEWVGLDWSAIECALYSPALHPTPHRAAAILTQHGAWTLSFDSVGPRPDSAGLLGFLAELHPVLRRSGALARLSELGMHPVTDSTWWLTADEPFDLGPALRWYQVLTSGSLAEVPALCHAYGVSHIAVKSAESRQPIEQIRRRIRLPDGDNYAAIFIDGYKGVSIAGRLREIRGK